MTTKALVLSVPLSKRLLSELETWDRHQLIEALGTEFYVDLRENGATDHPNMVKMMEHYQQKLGLIDTKILMMTVIKAVKKNATVENDTIWIDQIGSHRIYLRE